MNCAGRSQEREEAAAIFVEVRGVETSARLSFVVLLALEIAGAKWLFLGRVRPGNDDLHSGFIREWTLTAS